LDELRDVCNRDAAVAIAEEVWRDVCARWSEEQAHQDFVTLCDELEIWDWAANRYAQTRAERPGDPMARKMSSQILLLAQMRLDAVRRKRRSSPLGSKLGMAVLILLLLLVPLLLMLSIARQHERFRRWHPDASRPSFSPPTRTPEHR
jgi:hypothetical protein